MNNTNANIIVNHLQCHYGDFFKKNSQIDLKNPADVCGLSLFTEYIFRKLSTYELNEYIIKTIGWDRLMAAFKAIKANNHVHLLDSLKEFKPKNEDDNAIALSVFFAWNSHSPNDLYEKCVAYLSKNNDAPKIEKILSHLPPLPPANKELLDAAAIADYNWIKKLLDAGANPNILDDYNYSPLALAWYEYRNDFAPAAKVKKAVLLLIKSGSNPLLENNRRLVKEATYPPAPDIFEALLENGWAINSNEYAIAFDLIDTLERENHADTKKRFKKCLDIAIAYKVDLNKPETHLGRLPLTFANDEALINTLLKNGAQLEVQADNNLYYLTPLMKAVYDEDLDKVKFWLAKGIDINRRLAIRFTQHPLNFAPGLTALDIAKIKELPAMKAFLVEQGAVSGEPISWLIQITAYDGVNPNKAALIASITEIIAQEIYEPYKAEITDKLDSAIEYLLNKGWKWDFIDMPDHALAVKTQQALEKLGFKSVLV